MRQIISVLITAVFLLTLSACDKTITTPNDNDIDNAEPTATHVAPGGNFPDAPTLILNGKTLDVYTSHYELTEERAVVPLYAFLSSIGARYTDSPVNEYGEECYAFSGMRFVCVPDMHLFMLENDYLDFLRELEKEGKQLSRVTTADCGLLPKNRCWDCKRFSDTDSDGTLNVISAGLWVDHVSLMNALINCGINITIEYNYSTRTITVTYVDESETGNIAD